MREIDKKFLDCIEMCQYIEKKMAETDVQQRMMKEMGAYCLFICGKDINKAQAKYINSLLNMDINPKNVDFDVKQDAILEKNFEVFNLFITADKCFGESDYKFHGKKADVMASMYKTIGDDLSFCADEKVMPYVEGKVNTYMSKMYALLISDTKEVSTDGKNEPVEDERTLEELLAEFNEMTGLKSVKDEINGLINLVKVSKMREERGMKAASVSKHMVFTGNPGTGKTTVARLLANIYHKLGVLSKGQLVEVDRSGLVAGYVGQTAIKTGKVLDDAKGGILFIDEAYSLSENKGEGDFGQEAIDTILKVMEDNRDDLVIIVAGYTEPMERFLSSNPGLKSRFNKYIDFEDYTPEELVSIFNSMCKKSEYKFDDESMEKLQEKIKSMVDEKNSSFANARTMRNMLEFGIMKQATRIVEIEDLSDDDIMTINFDDIEKYILE